LQVLFQTQYHQVQKWSKSNIPLSEPLRIWGGETIVIWKSRNCCLRNVVHWVCHYIPRPVWSSFKYSEPLVLHHHFLRITWYCKTVCKVLARWPLKLSSINRLYIFSTFSWIFLVQTAITLCSM
jgi:hypothetical protein